MTTKIEGLSNRQKDTGWGYAFAHLIPFVWIYYAITRRTITPFLYQIGGGIILGFSIGVVSAIVIPNVEDDTLEGLGGLVGVVATPVLAKKGIDKARKFGKKQLENN
tara:strand:- start:34 stop:354 length:321 start_codon:yes stop_codon:yes gene_type:complete